MSRRMPVAILLALTILSVAATVRARDVGVRAGISSDPDRSTLAPTWIRVRWSTACVSDPTWKSVWETTSP